MNFKFSMFYLFPLVVHEIVFIKMTVTNDFVFQFVVRELQKIHIVRKNGPSFTSWLVANWKVKEVNVARRKQTFGGRRRKPAILK